jgi:hypothetical protein
MESSQNGGSIVEGQNGGVKIDYDVSLRQNVRGGRKEVK